MNNLKDLIFIINKRKLSQIDIFDKTLISCKDSLFSKFYQGLADGKFNSDDEAAHFLYGTDKADQRFRQLKHRFKKRLLNTLYFLDINSNSTTSVFDKAYYECINRLHICNIVQRYGGLRATTTYLINETYPTAVKHQFIDVLTEFSYKLLIQHALIGNEKQFQTELKKYNIFTKQLQITRESIIIYYETAIIFNKSKFGNRKEDINLIQKKIERLFNLYQDFPSMITFFNYTWVKLQFFDYTANNKLLLDTSNDFLENFYKYKASGNISTYLVGVNIYKTKALLSSRKFELTSQSANIIKQKTIGTNYFIISEFEFKAAINSTNINLAQKLISETIKHPQFKSLAAYLKERWLIYETYVILYNNVVNKEPCKIKINKLINQTPEITKDKQGFNLAIKILELLILLYQRKYIEYSNKIETFNTYSYRYLSKNEYKRIKLFTKLLNKLEKTNFNHKQLTNLNEYNLLKDAYLQQTLHESEIVFYDYLWVLILENLKQNK
ncbi:MAG: hypothetical protein R2760_05160 [Chitinophagales bacterium]|nr:hypothetical protein [Chitinophagales bacterium]